MVGCHGKLGIPRALLLLTLTTCGSSALCDDAACARPAAIIGNVYDRVLAGEAGQMRQAFEPLRPTVPRLERYSSDRLSTSQRDLERAIQNGDRAATLRASQEYLAALREALRTGDHTLFTDRRALEREIARTRAAQEQLFPETQSFTSRLWNLVLRPRRTTDANAIAELQRIETEMRALDPRTHAFRVLGRKKIQLLERNFADVAGMRRYLTDFAALFHIHEADRFVFMPINPANEAQRQLLRQFGETSSIHRLPGTVEGKLEAARTALRALGEPALETRDGRTYLPRGERRLFLAAEALALIRRANPTQTLTEAELRLAQAYENTVAELRSAEIEIRGAGHNDLAKLNFIISAVSDSVSTEREGRYYLDSAEPSVDHEFVRDRFRYAFASAAPGMTPEEALELTADVRVGQSEQHFTDLWWFGEARVTRDTHASFSGGLLLRRGDVANDRWMRMHDRRGGHDGHRPVPNQILTDANVLSGPLTAQVINGQGLSVDRNFILQRGGRGRVSRPYDPAQREAMVDGAVPTRTVGWQLVAEVLPTQSGNPSLRGVTRRIFWSEAPQDARDLARSAERPGAIERGEVRIAQQSVSLAEVVQQSLPENNALRREVETHLALRPRRRMPEALARRVQAEFNQLGEVDAVRGELIVGIEAIIEGRSVPRAMQWAWDPERGEWAFEEYIVKPGERRNDPERRRGESVLLNCQKCHAVRMNPATLRGRCTTSERSDDMFSGVARKALQRERAETKR